MALTYGEVVRVASGGVCNSGTAVDVAKIAVLTFQMGAQANGWGEQLLADREKTFTAVEVNNLLVNLFAPLDLLVAKLFDVEIETEGTDRD